MRKQKHFALNDSSHEELQINLTPLIDVVFVVLIMFIIIAPMFELDRIQLASSPKDHPQATSASENNPITIRVFANNTISFNNQMVQEKELMEMLKQAKKLYPQAIPQLYHDKIAPFGTYQIVKGAVETAGFEQLDIILQPK